ncbi:MAG: sugar ABC transporter ATP-binding protein [Planctomycetaceae bacterium]|nr:sugar ABC transporter ATP-binding protein [Planctomycetaceae bacterium]
MGDFPPFAESAQALLECRAIGKRFGGSVALDGVDFSLYPGEIHGLVGTNGAGKSTLMKILAGAVPDHDGEIFIEGRRVEFSTPAEALRLGVAMVYQDLSGVGQLSIAENLFLGRQPTTLTGRIDWTKMRRTARDVLVEMDIQVDVRRRLDRFPLVIRQMVEIARGLHSGARVLILDEPTSSLSPPETRRLFTLLKQLQARGVAIAFISHFIEDVLEICDRITILKDGRLVETAPARSLDKHRVIHRMLGHGLESAEPGYESATTLAPRTDKPACLLVEKLRLPGLFDEVSLQVAPGECLGLYGFVGAGHQELAHAIAGALKPTEGLIALDGRTLRRGDVHGAVSNGMVLVAADRAQTLVRGSEIYKNVTLAHLQRSVGNWLTRGRELAAVRPLLDRVRCRPPKPMLKAGSLSGGNQQKVVLAKWLMGPMRVLILEEPTRGMDVGAKDEIMKLVLDLKRKGTAVLLASTEPELILAHADRILTFRRGRITQEFSGTLVDKQTLLRHA